MRVVIAKKLLSSVGGSEAQARALAAALRDRGHDVRLVGLRPATRRPGIPDHVYSAPPGDVAVVEDGLEYRFIASPAALLEGTLPISVVGAGRLLPALANADVVHCLAREWAGPYERAAGVAGAAFVETPLVHPGQPFSGTSAADVARYRRDAAVIALTEWEAAWYRERGVERAFATGVGAILGAPLPAVARDPATVLFVGRKERYKGYDSLRAAAPLVWRERPDARFVVIGQRRFLGPAPLVDPRWSEPGIVSEARKAEAYARATVFAMPSEHETFGHTYLEAWCAGVPVIAGDIPPLREVVREGVDGLHTANEPHAVAAAILELLNDPRRAAALGAAGKQRASERFTWPAIASLTEAAYEAARLA
ncbi:MAG TPA: glycosyltransferase family 4 protein [Candidatus Limnocylindria bacterium]|nr:glycosyltransferase family 4 protein [Candidatus Limnocylindria bacterium]